MANALLGNWSVNVIEKITSGFPIYIYDSNNASGVNFNNNGNSYNRPNQVASPVYCWRCDRKLEPKLRHPCDSGRPRIGPR